MASEPIIIKKVKGHAGHAHHGGSWKVAYADFVTAMMAFFMVMWIMGLSDQTRAQIQGYFNDPLGFVKNQPRSKSIFAIKGMPTPKPGPSTHAGGPKEDFDKDALDKDAVEHVKDAIKKALASSGDLKKLLDNVLLIITPEGLRIELVETRGAVFFESGKAVIRPAASELIKHIAPILAASGRKLVVEGHTDAQPYGGKDYTNWDLSTDRALALRREMAKDGVGDGQVTAVRGLAATQLLKPDKPFDFSNRRVTILIPFDQKQGDGVVKPKDELKGAIKNRFQQAVEVNPAPPAIRPEAQ